MKTFEEVKLHNKPFEEMELLELYAERACRQWHRGRTIAAKDRVERKMIWLKKNRPIYSKEEIREQYENGLLSQKQFQTAFATRKRAINSRMRYEDYLAYADRVIFHEESIVAYIDELIAEKLAKEDAKRSAKIKNERKQRAKHRCYDPRKPRSKYNQNPLDPRRKWATREEDKPFPKLQKARVRWKKGKEHDTKSMTVMRKMQPIITWDAERLMAIARDRGYFTEVAVSAAIADALNITISGADKLLKSGRLTWSQCIIIGAIFEMTPKEYCDVFMSGYFVEVADGVFKAHVEDTETLLDAPYRAKPKEGDDKDD